MTGYHPAPGELWQNRNTRSAVVTHSFAVKVLALEDIMSMEGPTVVYQWHSGLIRKRQIDEFMMFFVQIQLECVTVFRYDGGRP